MRRYQVGTQNMLFHRHVELNLNKESFENVEMKGVVVIEEDGGGKTKRRGC